MVNVRNNMHWRAGYAAYFADMALTANNNPPNTEASDFWNEGYGAAMDDDLNPPEFLER